MRPHGRFHHVNPRHPQAKGICDRCGWAGDLNDLVWQYEWAGKTLQNLRLRVHSFQCLDEPNQQLRTINIPADPVPVKDPRPENFTYSRDNYYVTEDGQSQYTDESGNLLIQD
jgi:hypothetical protein